MSRAVCALLVLFASAELYGATVNGTITFITRRGQRTSPSETLVWLEPVTSAKAPKPESAVVATRSKALVPHILAVPIGSTIQFPNEDPISHNLFSVSSSNPFDLGLYRRGPGKTQQFTRPGVVNVYCNVHPNMSAVVHVMGTPYYAFADQSGAFSLADVPAGKYRLTAWSEQAGTTQREIQVTHNATANVSLTLDGRNFRTSQQHMNKYGKPYQTSKPKDY